MNNEIKSVVCLAASNTWYGKIIRRITRSNVNHAFVAYHSSIHGGWQALQTDERGLVEVPIESLKYTYKECYDFPTLNLMSALSQCRNLIGDRYDWMGIFGFLIKIFFWRLLGRKILNPLHKKGELFCSEFVIIYLQKVKGMFSWIMKIDSSSISPGGNKHTLGVPSLRELLRTNNEVQQIDCPF